MNLLQRIGLLKKDVAQGKRDHELLPHWEHELKAALSRAKHVDHTRPVPRDGVDYSWSRPAPPTLRKAGVTFVVRYLSGVPGKDLTYDEAKLLSKAGIDIVCMWETGAERMLDGGEAGKLDARRAAEIAALCGQPKHRPIYFACDLEIRSSGQLERCRDYLLGAGQVIGRERIGVYGPYNLLAYLHAAGDAPWMFQTRAWSNSKWLAAAQLRQVMIERVVAGVLVDLDRAMTADFGQWRL